MQNFVQTADVLTVAAPSGGVVSGDFVVVGAICGFAATTALAGADVELQREGVFSGCQKATGTAWTKGDVLYWDSSAKKFTKTATGNALIAAAAADAASGDATGSVLLDRRQPSGINNTLSSTAANRKFVSGQITTVAASDTVVTGLTTVAACGASLDDNPGDDPMLANASIGDQAGTPAAGSILVKTWKNTGGTDPTPLAATTFSKKVNWWAFGT